jgi:hypothetical protein
MAIHRLFAGALVAGLTSGTALAANLDPYVGKNMFDKIHGIAIYQVPEIKRDFIAKFGPKRWAVLLSYQTSQPTEAVNDAKLGRVIVTWQCKPSDCPNQAALVLRSTAEVVGACFGDAHGAEWLGPGWHVEAPQNDCSAEAAEIVARFRAASARTGR